MRKFRASIEPFWELKISKCVEYLMRVSSNKYASPVLCSAKWEQSEVQKLYCAVEFFSVIEASKLVTVEVESRSQTPCLRLRHQCRLCMHYNIIGDLLSHVMMQLLRILSSVLYIFDHYNNIMVRA